MSNDNQPERLLASLAPFFKLEKQVNPAALIESLSKRLKKIMTFPHTEEVFKGIESLKHESTMQHSYDGDIVKIASGYYSNQAQKDDLTTLLKHIQPWRKGPFSICDIHIDTEWQSQLKWNRIASHLGELKHQRILDIGCNSGYYMYRMLAHNPNVVVGIDPSSLCFFQFKLLQQLTQEKKLVYLPIGLEEMTAFKPVFDTVFSMGILYHARSPLDCLSQTRDLMVSRGTLFLETLIIPGEGDQCFCPPKTYSKMRNVYYLPTTDCLINWLERTGFVEIEVLSETLTTVEEQRQTEWSSFESLSHFLDPKDPTKTIEGYPAPRRVIIKAKRKQVGRVKKIHR